MGYTPSTNFLVLMSFEVMENNGVGWDDATALAFLELNCRPSSSRDAPVPRGLNRDTSNRINNLIVAIGQEESVDSARHLVEGSSAQFKTARADYKAWYRYHLSRTVNKRMSAAMVAANASVVEAIGRQANDEFPTISTFPTNDIGPEFIGPVICNGMNVAREAIPLVRGLIQATLTRLRKHYNRGHDAILGKKQSGGDRDLESSAWMQAERLMHKIMNEEKESVDGKDVAQVMDYVIIIAKHICWMPSKKTTFEVWRSFLTGLAESEGLEVSFETNVATTDSDIDKVESARSKGNRKKIRSETMTAYDLRQLYATLVDHFSTTDVSDAQNPLDDNDDDVTHLYGVFEEKGNDMGVTKYKSKDEAELRRLLQFPDGRPPQFAKYRHPDSTQSSWDDPKNKVWSEGGEGYKPLELLWHQLCGIATIADDIFQKRGQTVLNKLLADDVGIGKSAQIMGVIAFLFVVYFAEKEGHSRPPLIDDKSRLFMGRYDSIPDLPHLLIVPNPLVEQWTRELKTFFAAKRIEIHVLPSSEAAVEQYLNDVFRKSDVPDILRVVICSHSTLANLTGQYFDTKRSIRSQPLDVDRRIRSSRTKTLFHQQFCLIAIDEIHEFRGSRSRAFIGAVALAKTAALVIGATATPVVSQPRDLVSIGRVLRIPQCSDKDGYELDRRFNREVRNAQRGITQEDKEESARLLTEALRSNNNNVRDSGMSPAHQTVKAVRYGLVKEMQGYLGRVMIRRTLQSTRWDGTKINPNLPEKSVVNFCVKLTDEEMVVLNGELAIVGESAASHVYEFERFWVHYRQCLCVPIPDMSEKKSKDVKWPVYSSLSDFKAAGSKVKKVIQLIQYHLSHPDAPQVDSWDEAAGDMGWPDISSLPPGLPSRSPKILVFFYFAAMADTLTSAFTLHGIKSESITGATGQKKRTEAIDRWRASASIPVLLFSTVAATGMNLSEARIVIHLDVSWSGVFQQQIDGRAWRYGQKEQVFVYRMVALGTTDVSMSSMAGEKTTFLGALTRQAKDTMLDTILKSMKEIEEEEFDAIEEDSEDDDRPKRKRKAPSKKGKAKAVEHSEDVQIGKETAGPKKKGKAKSKKQGDVVEVVEVEKAPIAGPSKKPKPKAKSKKQQDPVEVPQDTVLQSASGTKKTKAKSGAANTAADLVEVHMTAEPPTAVSSTTTGDLVEVHTTDEQPTASQSTSTGDLVENHIIDESPAGRQLITTGDLVEVRNADELTTAGMSLRKRMKPKPKATALPADDSQDVSSTPRKGKGRAKRQPDPTSIILEQPHPLDLVEVPPVSHHDPPMSVDFDDNNTSHPAIEESQAVTVDENQSDMDLVSSAPVTPVHQTSAKRSATSPLKTPPKTLKKKARVVSPTPFSSPIGPELMTQELGQLSIVVHPSRSPHRSEDDDIPSPAPMETVPFSQTTAVSSPLSTPPASPMAGPSRTVETPTRPRIPAPGPLNSDQAAYQPLSFSLRPVGTRPEGAVRVRGRGRGRATGRGNNR